MLRKLSVVLLSAGAFAFAGCSSSSPPTPDSGPPAVTCTTASPPTCTIPAGATEAAIDSAIAAAVAGTTFNFAAGTFEFTNTIAVPGVASLSFLGAGMGSTILDFANQAAGAGGINASLGNANIKFENFTIQNTLGNAIFVEHATGAVFYQVQVLWSNAADGGPNYPRHGGYGIYPVQSENVLIDHCDISGARDTGAYIGQSYNIVVSNNNVHQNVAGIEIESSVSADVHDNTSTGNTAGLLVFALPNLQPPPDAGQPNDGATNVRVYNNTITTNNTTNFADPSGTVWQVPAGSGIVVMAAENVEVFGNTVSNNDTLAFALASYLVIDPTFNPTDPAQNPTGLNPFAQNVYVHDNTFASNGSNPIDTTVYAPDGGQPVNQLGELFVTFLGLGAWSEAPDLIWDGIAPPPYTPPQRGDSSGTPANPLSFFIQNNHNASVPGADFANVNLPVVYVPPATINVNAINFNADPFTATSAPAPFPLPAVDAGVIP